jgi:hypothetical protein
MRTFDIVTGIVGMIDKQYAKYAPCLQVADKYPISNTQLPIMKFGLAGFARRVALQGEGEAARRGSNMLIGSAGVFSAIKRPKGIEFA